MGLQARRAHAQLPRARHRVQLQHQLARGRSGARVRESGVPRRRPVPAPSAVVVVRVLPARGVGLSPAPAAVPSGAAVLAPVSPVEAAARARLPEPPPPPPSPPPAPPAPPRSTAQTPAAALAAVTTAAALAAGRRLRGLRRVVRRREFRCCDDALTAFGTRYTCGALERVRTGLHGVQVPAPPPVAPPHVPPGVPPIAPPSRSAFFTAAAAGLTLTSALSCLCLALTRRARRRPRDLWVRLPGAVGLRGARQVREADVVDAVRRAATSRGVAHTKPLFTDGERVYVVVDESVWVRVLDPSRVAA